MRTPWGVILVLALACAPPAWAQAGQGPEATPAAGDAEQRLLTLEAQMRGLLLENQALRAEVNELKKAPVAGAATGAGKIGTPPAEAKKDGVAIHASFKEGLKVKAEDGNFEAHIGGRLLTQSRFFIDHTRDNDSFFVREARLEMEGTVYKDYEFKVQADFGKGAAQLQDGFVGWKKLPWLGLRVGQLKEPFSLQQLTSARFIDFVERSPMDLLTPGRDLGVQLAGKCWDGRIEYALGFFNGNGKNNAADANDDKDLAARIVLRPFLPDDNALLKGLRIGAAVTDGNQKQNQGNFTTLDSATTFLAMNAGVRARGDRTRWNVEGAWTYGPFKLQGEATWQDLELNRAVNGVVSDEGIDFTSYYVEGLWVVTGESPAYDRRKPAKNFGSDGGPGQIELALRYSQFWVDDDIFARGFANTGNSTEGLDNWTAGVNWWLNPNTRVSVNYFHNDFWDDIPVGGIAEGKFGRPRGARARRSNGELRRASATKQAAEIAEEIGHPILWGGTEPHGSSARPAAPDRRSEGD
ncbi:MAG: hypothetical protein HYZ53_12405 [Planctomycetes bacterium]|nr:hypothetical protein [Planctomycetota bacterium]